MYERFRDRRMDVCGLDLEPVPKEKGGGVAGGEEMR